MQLPDVQQWLLYMLAALAVWWVVSRIRKRRAAKRAAQHRAAARPRQSTQRQPARRQPPPLPRRTPDPAPLASQARPLPPRSAPVPARAGADAGLAARRCGPRGLRPDKFPCCPYDKQRNLPGMPQVIFWDSGGECYRCARGHRFRKNGKFL